MAVLNGVVLVSYIRKLQDEGLDTVEANLALGFPDDLRRYDVAAAIVRSLGIRSIALLTNNPTKIGGLRRAGLVVTRSIALRTDPNPHNSNYLATKRSKSGHLL